MKQTLVVFLLMLSFSLSINAQYIEVDGKCVMEGENATVSQRTDSTGWASPYSGPMMWKEETTVAGFAGTGYMTTEEGVALNGSWDNATELAWEVTISTEGEYFIAVRRHNNNDGQSDSAKPGVDGEEKAESTFWGAVTEFTWARGPSLGTLSAGNHTIQIRRREDGMMVDRVMIATTLDALPAEGATEVGADENVFTVDNTPVGSGTEADPYQISNLDELLWVSNTDSTWNSYFVQTTNIDASATSGWNDNGSGGFFGFSPIGNDGSRFGGYYDGQGHTIDGLYINRPATDNIGLFGVVQDPNWLFKPCAKDLGLTNVNITGKESVGGLIGQMTNGSTVSGCHTTGTVSGENRVGGFVGYVKNGAIPKGLSYSSATVSGTGSVGGFVGRVEDNAGIIVECYSNGVVNCASAGPVGGFVGKCYGSVSECYSNAVVTISGGGPIGGFAGKNSATISNCYTFSDVSRDGGGHHTFGFAGENSGVIDTCYAAGTNDNGSGARGFIGANTGTATDNYYDSDTYGADNPSVGATAKTTAEMKMESTYSNWDFSAIWETNDNYPNLVNNSNPDLEPIIEFVAPNFLVPPHAIGTTKLSMTAIDTVGNIAEYLFECITDGGHSSSWQTSDTFVDSNLTMNAKYFYAVKGRDASGNETEYSDTISARTDYIGELVYAEADGKCVMEAEKANVLARGDFSMPGWGGIPYKKQMRWEADTTGGGYAGSGYMVTEGGIAQNANWDAATELGWEVEITTEGEYFIAVRRNSNGDGGMDSAKPGVDGEEKSSSTFWGSVTEFTWAQGPSLGNLSAGLHTIQIRRRECGFKIDRVMIATSLDLLPAEGSTEVGPDETIKGEIALPDGRELLVNNYFDDGLNNWQFAHGEAVNTIELDTTGVITGKNSAHITVNKSFDSYPSGRIRLAQANLPEGIKTGGKYFITMKIKSNKAIEKAFWTVYKNSNYVDYVANGWGWTHLKKDTIVTYSDTLVAVDNEPEIYFSLDFAAFEKDSVELWIDDVHMIEIDGTVGVKNNETSIPNAYSLNQNYPNPFNPTTVISFALPKASDVQLSVYNILGEKITELVNSKMTAGNHTVNFNATNLSSGLYIYRIQAGSFVSVKKMMLLK